jgi:anti-sigma B factor antagonist
MEAMDGIGDQKSVGPNDLPSPPRAARHCCSGEIELSFTSHTVPRAKPLLLDISDVTFLASLGLRMLLTVAKALDRRGAKTVLLSPQPAVREVLKLSGFDQLMPVHNDEETALAFLAGSEGR